MNASQIAAEKKRAAAEAIAEVVDYIDKCRPTDLTALRETLAGSRSVWRAELGVANRTGLRVSAPVSTPPRWVAESTIPGFYAKEDLRMEAVTADFGRVRLFASREECERWIRGTETPFWPKDLNLECAA